MALTSTQIEDLRSALSAQFGADLADELSDVFLCHLVAQMPPTVVSLASRWGWDDTEVREKVCAQAERVLGTGDPDGARDAHAAWLRQRA